MEEAVNNLVQAGIISPEEAQLALLKASDEGLISSSSSEQTAANRKSTEMSKTVKGIEEDIDADEEGGYSF